MGTEQQKPYSGNFYKKEVLKNGKLTLYRCPFYVPKNPGGLKRVMHEASFFLSAFFMIVRMLFKPGHDYIFCVAPPFHLGFLGLFYRFFKGGKLIYHIQDLQIEAARDLKVLKPEAVFKWMFRMERFILKNANYISSISAGMIKKITLKAEREIIFFPNWVNTDMFFPIPDRNLIKKEWGFKPDNQVVLYSGSIGEKQGLETLIDIAVKLRVNSRIQFLICGTGPYKQKLIELAKSAGADNMHFLPLQELDVFNRFLNMADVHLILQKANASDLMMPSKLNTILASGGLALATAEAGSSLYEVIKDHKMGMVIPPENAKELYEAILKCCTGNYSLQRINARIYAEQYLEKESILTGVTRHWRDDVN